MDGREVSNARAVTLVAEAGPTRLRKDRPVCQILVVRHDVVKVRVRLAADIGQVDASRDRALGLVVNLTRVREAVTTDTLPCQARVFSVHASLHVRAGDIGWRKWQDRDLGLLTIGGDPLERLFKTCQDDLD